MQTPGNLLPYFAENNFLYDLGEIGELALPQGQYSSRLLESISYQGKLWGVPLSAALACDFYDLKQSDFLREVFAARSFWDYWEGIADKNGARSGGGGAMTFLRRHLFHFFAMAGADATCSYDAMKRFDTQGQVDFVEKFEKYIRTPGIFYQTLEGSAEAVPYIKHLLDSLAQGEFFILPGNSVYLADIMSQSHTLRYGIVPACTEKGGAPVIDVNLNAISHYSPYPEECLRLLEYLGSYEVQKYFAEHGRPVANVRALEHLQIPGLDQFSLGNLRDGLAKGGGALLFRQAYLRLLVHGGLPRDDQVADRKDLRGGDARHLAA